MNNTMRIGEAAERVGVASSAIRYYESLGILPEPDRTESGYRGYHEDDIDARADARDRGVASRRSGALYKGEGNDRSRGGGHRVAHTGHEAVAD